MIHHVIGRLAAIPYSLALVPAFQGIAATDDLSKATAAPALCALAPVSEAPDRKPAAAGAPSALRLRFGDGADARTPATLVPLPKPTVSPVKPVPTLPSPVLPTVLPTLPADRTATGSIYPRHLAFTEVANTPTGYSVWQLDYGLKYTGGLAGSTEDTEFQILDRSGSGSIDSAGVFTGCLDGLAGGFAFESEGTQNPDGSFEMSFVITPGTGHGRLTGISGRFKVVATRAHCGPADTPETCTTLVSYTLAYRLGS